MRILAFAMIFFILITGVLAAGCSGYSNTPGTVTPTSNPAVSNQQSSPAAIAPSSQLSGSDGGGRPVLIELSAGRMAFSLLTISVPASSAVTVDFQNKEAAGSSQVTGIAHNFALYTSAAATTPLYRGEVITGGEEIRYSFTAPATPGTYFFRDDLYPQTMNGTFQVT